MGELEAHCHQLVHALVTRHHEVTLYASADSDAALPLVGVARATLSSGAGPGGVEPLPDAEANARDDWSKALRTGRT